jgi:cell fate regulator YaaT (PSP1 superfamily)
MGCVTCDNSRGCATLPAGCKSNGGCASGGCNKMNTFDWLAGVLPPSKADFFSFAEVRFKNTRKEFFKIPDNIPYLHIGDVVAVESSAGHDIGIVSLVGESVRLQMKRKGVSPNSRDIKRIFRKAHQKDIDKWQQAIQREENVLIESRKIIKDLGLQMKLSDVEFQGDNTKATFYYIADNRVDFRELIKVLADKYKIRVEMRQIGVRQEAGRVGGIGSCGRELCCSTFLNDFRSVSTTAARYQQLSINPVKLAGQCGKLKCCLNYELDVYVEALQDFPPENVKLKTQRGEASQQKIDVFKRIIWYSYDHEPYKFYEIPVERAKEIIEMNKKGKMPEDLIDFNTIEIPEEPDFDSVVGQDDINRFDKKMKSSSKKKRRNNQKRRNKKKQ